jgi:short subunit dehydrogenase-like uncharacterized protein
LLYGATGHTGALIARHALDRGHHPVLAGRSGPAVAGLADQLNLQHRTLSLEDPAALAAALGDVELVLNVAGPFLHTAAPLADACLNAGVHYLDISNELQVFRALYHLDERAQRVGVTVMPGVGFGVIATNCLARYVSEASGGAEYLELATRIASAEPGPGAAATMKENIPYGGWIREGGQLVPRELFTGSVTIDFPDGPSQAMPVPTGDLEAAFRATGAPNIISYAAAAPAPPAPVHEVIADQTYRSFGWARATGPDGATVKAIVETGDSYAFTASASIRALEETLARSLHGAFSPAGAFGADFVLTIEHTTRTDVPEGSPHGPLRGERPLEASRKPSATDS